MTTRFPVHIPLFITLLGLGASLAAACGDEFQLGTGGAGGTGGATSAGGAGGACGDACCAPTDCQAPAQACLERTCVDGQCGLTATAPNTPSPWQVPGDCRSFICDAQGSATEVPDSSDTLDDHNACTTDACTSAGPVNQLLPESAPCSENGGSLCNAAAECVQCIFDEHCSGDDVCLAEHCVPPTCANMVHDPGETGTDCGGPCGATCEPGQGCQVAADCADGVCAGAVCAAATCSDGVKNGDETDVDCGGSCQANCGSFQGCKVHGDCAGNQCSGTLCIPNCQDGEQNGAETDIDCGGPSCSDCAVGATCQLPSDCQSGACTGNICCDTTTCEKQEVLSVTAGMTHSCALLSGGRVKCWGSGARGALGYGDTNDRADQPGEMGASLPPVNLGTSAVAIGIEPGYSSTCAILDSSQVKCWGANGGIYNPAPYGDEPGEMGDALPFVQLGTGRTVTALAVGYYHNCALLDGGDVKCWGRNDYGQLGLEDTVARNDVGTMGDNLPTVQLGTGVYAIDIAVGFTHSCAVLNNGEIKCWGWNDFAQLGNGSWSTLGDEPGEMGDALPAALLGTGQTAVAVSAGLVHTCALLSTAHVKCWGANSSGQLGIGDTTARGHSPGEMGDALPAVQLGTGRYAVKIASGVNHNCVVLDDKRVKCWGDNQYGQLGLGDTEHRGDNPGEMGDNLSATALGLGAFVTSIDSSGDHSCVTLSDRSTKCWGNNAIGQLGLGDTANRGDNGAEMGDSLPRVKLFSNVW